MREFICPNPHCGFRGYPERIARGSRLVLWLLLLLGGLPGLLYMVFASGYRYVCPMCSLELRRDLVG